ncbi:hypothetical protein IFM89_003163 [Coptis chinensis]|uniref:Uncharacterized protein n=1 Tax=Coptis chinensis TaxID=261450 RepID=A0A835IB86_9MAGN|nr:hypothetical protein IFM89_003163 [Coptis chinensis]
MRIGDVLKSVDDEEDEKVVRSSSSCNSSKRSSSKLEFSKLKDKIENVSQERSEKNEVGCKFDDEGLKSSNSVTHMVDDSSGGHVKDVSFTLGLGVGLIFLTAATKKQFTKMMELRSEMETLIQEVKDERHRKDATVKPSESSDTLVSSAITSTEVGSMDNHANIMSCVTCVSSYPLEEVENTMACDNHLQCDIPRNEDWRPEIDQLEAEVEAELQRLQLRLDAEDLSEHPQQQRTEAQLIVQQIAHEESLTANRGEVDDPDGGEEQNGICPDELKRRLRKLLEEREQQRAEVLESTTESSGFGEVDNTDVAESGEQNGGVSPKTLERRLNELLEVRQQERIEELELALECVQRKLLQKELEVSWWKDIAHLISQHVSDVINLPR